VSARAWLLTLALASVTTSASAQWNGGRLAGGRLGFRDAGLGGIRGVTVGPIESSQWPGRGYGTPYSDALLDELVRLGVTWVSITPFGRIWSLTSTDITMDFEAPYEDNRIAITRFVEQAHERGIRVLLIPHLWVWSEVGWRGEIDPGTPEGWAEYQASYRAFVLAWARDAAAAEVDAFSIGVECKSWSGRFGSFLDRPVLEQQSRLGVALGQSLDFFGAWHQVHNQRQLGLHQGLDLDDADGRGENSG